MAIEIQDVEHLAALARIEISDTEKENFKNDLEEILSYVSQIKEVTAELGAPEAGLPAVAVTAQAGELRNVLRADENPHEGGIFTEDILAEAPQREGNRVVVKKIL